MLLIKLFILFLLLSSQNVLAEKPDSLSSLFSISIETVAGFSTHDFQPHWQTYNRYGLLHDNAVDGYLLTGIFAKPRPLHFFTYDYGLQLAGKTNQGDSHIHQAYLRLQWEGIHLYGGRLRSTHGLQYDPLSSGSLAISTNARPITRIALTVPEFIPIPYTQQWVSFRAHYAHGWLDSGRHVEDPWLHEKFIYGRLGQPQSWFRFYAGKVHYAKWSGVSPIHGQLPNTFDDYLRVITGRSANSELIGTSLEGWVKNAIGDHLGITEFALEGRFQGFNVLTYRQIPYEDGSGRRVFKNRDFLHGFTIRTPESQRFVKTIVFESVKTTWQTGPGIPDEPEGGCALNPQEPVCAPDYPFVLGGRDDYYNHGTYRDGWTYHGFTIGSSLLMNRLRAVFFYPDANFGTAMFVSNRVRGHHLGFSGDISAQWNYRVKITRNSYRGTYRNIDIYNQIINPDAPFADEPLQYHTMLELHGKLMRIPQISWTVASTLDFGDFGTTGGMLTGIRYDF